MIFDDLKLETLKVFPVEIWLIIKKIYIRNYLKENLLFPFSITRRIHHEFFADYYQVYMKDHRWDIEIASMSQSSLVSHHFKGKRISIEWAGVNMMIRERVFGIGFNISQLFLESIFLDDDYMEEFLPSIDLNSSSDEEDENDYLFYY